MRAGEVPQPAKTDSEEFAVILESLRRLLAGRRGEVDERRGGIKGVTEETPPASTASTRWRRPASCSFPAINVNDSVTKSKFDNIYGCRHSLVDGINRGRRPDAGGQGLRDLRIRRRRQGCAQALKGQGARVVVTEIDPICALQASMEGYAVRTLDDVVETADVFITATGNKDIITRTT